MEDLQFDRSHKNERLRDIVREALVSGEYRPGDRMPSQNEMCDQFGVSPNTVREAIASLVHEGLLFRVQGKGTFVADKRSKHVTIGMVIHRLTVPSYNNYRRSSDISPALVHFVQEEANEDKAAVMLYISNDDPETERGSLEDLIARRVDGIIMLYVGGKRNLDCLEQVRRAGIPLVLVDRYVEGFDCDYVVSDNFSSAHRVVDTLMDMGHSNILHYTYEHEIAGSAVKDRTAGYMAAMAKHGADTKGNVITFSTELIPATVNDYREKIVSSLEHFKGQSAVFTTNPGILQQLWPFIEETGVPHDQIALACFDHPYPGLPEDVVVVKAVQPLEQIARRSVRILLDKLRGVHRLEQQRIEATIEVIGIDQLAGCDLAAAGQALRS